MLVSQPHFEDLHGVFSMRWPLGTKPFRVGIRCANPGLGIAGKLRWLPSGCNFEITLDSRTWSNMGHLVWFDDLSLKNCDVHAAILNYQRVSPIIKQNQDLLTILNRRVWKKGYTVYPGRDVVLVQNSAVIHGLIRWHGLKTLLFSYDQIPEWLRLCYGNYDYFIRSMMIIISWSRSSLVDDPWWWHNWFYYDNVIMEIWKE